MVKLTGIFRDYANAPKKEKAEVRCRHGNEERSDGQTHREEGKGRR